MKRYRIFSWDFDTRIAVLTELEDIYKAKSSVQLGKQIDEIRQGLENYYGARRFEYRLQNLKDIGPKHFSIVAYHNVLLEQIRDSFIQESYYPALVSACALGERILNHLILDLRDHYKGAKDYESVKSQKSIPNWNTMIKALGSWGVLLPNTVEEFGKLKGLRHKSIHFNPELTNELRNSALEAVNTVQNILYEQFSSFGNQPWFITSIPGEIYLKKEWEKHPFVSNFYVPDGFLVGPNHTVQSVSPLTINDDNDYSDVAISDEEFSKLRNERTNPI